MKNLVAVICLLSISLSAFGFQTPLQQSAGAVNAVMNAVKKDTNLQLLSIRKISISNSNAKIELVDQKGVCTAIPFELTADAMGIVKAEVMTNALAECK